MAGRSIPERTTGMFGSIPDPPELLRLYRQMLLIRRFEEKSAEMYALGKIGGFCHLYIGQEAVAVGAISAIRDEDIVLSAYRDHGHAIAKGLDPRQVMAELFGRSTGSCRGKGGSMHLFDVKKNFLGGYAIVGGHIPVATGVAFAVKYRERDQVVLCFFGEGAVNTGAFHEALNLAALWRLPIIYICENNRYGMGTPVERAASLYNISQSASAYDMAREEVDGMDVLAVRERVARAAERARLSGLPTFIEARTYRFMGHSMSDPAHGHYRTKEEIDEQKRNDPLATFPKVLLKRKAATEADLMKIEKEVRSIVEESIQFADESPPPSPDELMADIFAEDPPS